MKTRGRDTPWALTRRAGNQELEAPGRTVIYSARNPRSPVLDIGTGKSGTAKRERTVISERIQIFGAKARSLGGSRPPGGGAFGGTCFLRIRTGRIHDSDRGVADGRPSLEHHAGARHLQFSRRDQHSAQPAACEGGSARSNR